MSQLEPQASPSSPHSTPSADLDLPALLALALEVAIAAGSLLREGLSGSQLEARTKSSRTDMVTDVDRASEAQIVASIRAVRPEDAILGEEGGERPGTSGVRWIIDPLDGTTNYLYGYPVFSVSVAAELLGKALLGVVHDPLKDETFSAIRDGGASLNGDPMHVRASDDLRTALVGTGFSYASAARDAQARALVGILPHVRDIRRAGSAALDLCWVAAGRLDAYFESGTSLWDRAAGVLIVREAGGWVGSAGGGPESDDLVIASSPGIASPLRQLLSDAGSQLG